MLAMTGFEPMSNLTDMRILGWSDKIEMIFSIRRFFQKTKKTNSTLLRVDLFSFVFWKKVKTPKRHFEIN